ncbi:MAG TPA: type II toxin-antitoxin system RelE/ParE family toxin [Thermoanaerobaculia bacterium]|nr:type II toxin-antitoxin system RelE/ParE family toxin [Thermoanaerobaculia bacterium]
MREVVIMPRAQRQYDAASRWWLTHRSKAPDAFQEDFLDGLARLTENASIGSIVVRKSRFTVRRLYLERVQYFVYYRVRDEAIEVVSVWHASRGSRPRF